MGHNQIVGDPQQEFPAMVLSYMLGALASITRSIIAIASFDYPDKFPYYQWTNVENYIFAEHAWKLPIAMWSNDWTWLASSDWPALAKIDPEWEEVGSLLLAVCLPYDEYLRRDEAKDNRESGPPPPSLPSRLVGFETCWCG